MAIDGNRAVAQQLADQLTDGFLALSGEYQLLREQHRQLEEQLSWAKKQHQEILRRFVPDTADDEFALYLDDLVEAGKGTRNGQSDWLEILSQNPSDGRSGRAFLIRQAELAIETLKNIAEAKEPLGVKIWSGPSADKEPECQVSGGTVNGAVNSNIHSPLEKDFTVPGPPSKLGCPFAKPNGLPASQSGKNSLATPRSSMSKLSPLARRSMRSSFHDPIRAEINGIQDALSAPSIEGSTTGICPIRFLDQHSPEEVAQYFENHKHEIPRSHEICIKRFQSNADQVRQLDAKYGNMVSMIQGLGQKHQPMLPEKPAEEDDDEVIQDEQDEASDKVKNWAEEVNASLADGETGNPHGDIDLAPEQDEDARESRFDRPLKEVRVGESPSRPWGITVPAKYAKTAEVSSTRSPATASPLEEPQTIRPSGCPFDHTKLQARVSDLPDIDTPKPERAASPLKANHIPIPPAPGPTKSPVYGEAPKGAAPVPQMVFTGPVFIGYSPEIIQQFMAQGVGKTA